MSRLLPERKRAKPQIVLTNLIDVILMMVFFFMITTSFAKQARKLPLELPQSGTAVATEQDILTVQYARDGTLLAGEKPCAPGELPAVVAAWVAADPARAIVLHADGGLEYGKVVAVLDTIRKAGGRNIGVGTAPEKGRG